LNGAQAITDTVTDYYAVQTALESVDSATGPAECHGIAVGLLCAAKGFEPEVWFDHLFGEGYALTPNVMRCAHLLHDLAVDVDRQLKSDEFEIVIFLPENASLSDRVAALADWCQGFLLGISLAKIGDLKDLPVDSREFVQDLNDIARVGIESEDSTEADERAYVELVEYVRVGVLLLRSDVESRASA
jgi:uncharacterized protein